MKKLLILISIANVFLFSGEIHYSLNYQDKLLDRYYKQAMKVLDDKKCQKLMADDLKSIVYMFE